MALEKTAKKKKWISIVSPKEFNNQQIGETAVLEPKTLLNKKISVNLMSLSGDVKRQSVNVVFRIQDVKDSEALAEVVSYGLMQSYVRRVVRKGSSKLDDSFVCESKDNIKLRFKPLLQTRFKACNKTLKDIRKKTRALLTDGVKKQDYTEVMSKVISNELQKSIMDGIKKIYPISFCGFRVVERVR